jgi:hypothetical protein
MNRWLASALVALAPWAQPPAKLPRTSEPHAPAVTRLNLLTTDYCLLFFFITPLAVEFEAEAGGAALFGEHPLAPDERRVVADVLRVAAVEDGPPVALVVEVVSDDAPPHHFPSRM